MRQQNPEAFLDTSSSVRAARNGSLELQVTAELMGVGVGRSVDAVRLMVTGNLLLVVLGGSSLRAEQQT